MKLSISKGCPRFGFVIVIILSSSATIQRWTTVNYSDGLLLALFSLAAFLIYTRRKMWASKDILKLFFLIIITTYTKQTLSIWLCIAIYFLIIRQKRVAIVTLLSSFIAAIPSIITFPYKGLFKTVSETGVFQQALEIIFQAIKVNFIEFAQLIVLDRPLAMIVCLVIWLSIRNRANHFQLLFFLVTIGVLIINSTVGIVGVNFRYMLPVIPFAVLVIFESNFARNAERILSKPYTKNKF